MIKSLRLESFGRFRGKTFAFAPATLFSGPNESGKTTLFDALFDALSSPKATTAAGKLLAERYGRDRQAFCEYSGEPLAIAAADFLNLFAVRSGEISLEIEQNSQWANRVKASLFSGGIDPQSIAAHLEKKIIESREKNSLNGEAKRITAELKDMESEREKSESLRRSCLDEEKRIAGAGDRMAQTAAESSRLAAAAEEMEKSLYQQNLLQEEKALKDILANAAELGRKKGEQERFSRFSRAAFEDLKKREAEALRLRTEADKAAALEEEALRALAGSAEEKAQAEGEKSRGDSLRILADLLRDTLVPREKLVRTKTRRVFRKPFLAAAGIFVIAGAAAFFLAPQGWGILAAAWGAAAICAALSSTRQTQDDTSRLDEAIQAARGRWKKETGEETGVRYEEVLATLDRAAERSRAAAQDSSRAAARIAGLEQEAAARTLRRKQAGDAAAAALRQLRSLLDEAGTAGITDYAALLEKKENILVRCGELEEKLKPALVDYNAASAAELEGILGRKMAEISGKITETELPAQ
ncbi:MAG: ATP-binding protein, partial [Spirochaetaceae bacterium]|nr:ATP-binding protein [Spirochaetaceae bacterium]